MDHKACQENLSAYIDGELSAEERALLDEHLAGCSECRKIADGLKSVSAIVRKHAARPVPLSLRSRIFGKRRESAGFSVWLKPALGVSVAAAGVFLMFNLWRGHEELSLTRLPRRIVGTGLSAKSKGLPTGPALKSPEVPPPAKVERDLAREVISAAAGLEALRPSEKKAPKADGFGFIGKFGGERLGGGGLDSASAVFDGEAARAPLLSKRPALLRGKSKKRAEKMGVSPGLAMPLSEAALDTSGALKAARVSSGSKETFYKHRRKVKSAKPEREPGEVAEWSGFAVRPPEKAATIVIKDVSSWFNLWPQISGRSVPLVDFRKHMVIGLLEGESSGAIRPQIEKIETKGGKIFLYYRTSKSPGKVPPSGGGYHLKAIPKSGLPVVFKRIR